MAAQGVVATQRVVVIGAGYAGLTAALRVSKQHAVTLVNAADHFVERVRLHEYAAGHPQRSLPIAELTAGRNITSVTARVVGIDPARHQVELTDGTRLPYDTLVYALGSHTDTTAPGVAEYAYTAERAHELYNRLNGAAGTIAVVGGGLTGIEMAAELGENATGWQVHLVSGGVVGPGLGERARAYVLRAMDRLGVTVHERTRVVSVHEAGLVTDQGGLAADVVVWCASFTVSDLAAKAGLTVDGRGRVEVDGALRSVSHPDVFVVGDAARVVVPGTGELRMSCAAAMPLGAHAADAIMAVARDAEAPTMRFRFAGQCVSLGRADGLVQLVRRDDAPANRVFTGRTAVWIKETICKYTVWSLRREQRRPGAYTWLRPKAPKAAAVPAGVMASAK